MRWNDVFGWTGSLYQTSSCSCGMALKSSAFPVTSVARCTIACAAVFPDRVAPPPVPVRCSFDGTDVGSDCPPEARAGLLGGHRPMGHPYNGWNFVTAGTLRDANSVEEIVIEEVLGMAEPLTAGAAAAAAPAPAARR